MKNLFRLLLFPLAFIRLLLVLMVSFFFLFIVYIEYRISLRTGKYHFWSMRNWGKIVCWILGIKVEHNAPPTGGKYIIMPNHTSYLDILLIAAYSPSAFVAKAELKSWPILGQTLKAGHIITVNRKELSSLLNTMKRIRESVEGGMPVTVFPEGTTSKGPELLPFKNGSFKIAADLKVDIVPCAIVYHDKGDVWIGDDTFIAHFFRQMWQPVKKVKLFYGTPLQSEDYLQLKTATRKSIEQLLELTPKN
ncbi:lysophospholipid acyltransferase family protein [Roseimarinus sediminis]|uniref:lysophospholipid acyltransferase family protein n=1 Tax=Roseimarinus sediminis TaxID=1610899 RepID=UPI003D216524